MSRRGLPIELCEVDGLVVAAVDASCQAVEIVQRGVYLRRSHATIRKQGTLRWRERVERGIGGRCDRGKAATLLVEGVEEEQAIVDDCSAYGSAELLAQIVRLYVGAGDGSVAIVGGDRERVGCVPCAGACRVETGAVQIIGAALRDGGDDPASCVAIEGCVVLGVDAELADGLLREGVGSAGAPP